KPSVVNRGLRAGIPLLSSCVLLCRITLHPAKLIPDLPEIHVHELHDRIVHPTFLRDACLFRSQFGQVVGAELQQALNKTAVQIGIAETATLEAVNKIPVARRQTPQRTENDFGHQGIGWLAKWRVCLSYSLDNREDSRDVVEIGWTGPEF